MTTRIVAVTLGAWEDPWPRHGSASPSLRDLNEAAALLNIPGMDDADRNAGAPLHLQQAALLARIADWAGLCARAAKDLGDLDFSGVTERYAYLIETVDEHDGT
jgi:hypothetical protein